MRPTMTTDPYSAGCDAAAVTSASRECLVAGLEGLPCLTRTVFMLHRLDDRPYDQIAWRCGISVDEVTLRMADALTGLGRSCDGDPTFFARIRRAMMPWRFAWARWRRERQDRQLGL
jgi:DNA-directed RNA polymerase specialized sigma24 family protein